MGGGRHKFKLSDLMPNAWFHKLKNMKKPITNLSVDDDDDAKPKNRSPPPSTVLTPSNTFSPSSSSTPSSSSSSRTSLYFKRDPIIASIQNSSNTHILKSPRKSARRSRSSNRVSLSSPRRRLVNAGTGCACHHLSEDSTDRSVKIDNTNKAPTRKDSTFIEIPPIVTKKAPKSNDTRARTTPAKRVSVSSPGVKLRTHSPRMMVTRRSDNIPPPRWRGRSRSLAVVKSSMNPQKDFKESMVEMILVNDIKGGKNLEDLLACYLELNSDGYHDLIINVFKQIWFDLNLKM